MHVVDNYLDLLIRSVRQLSSTHRSDAVEGGVQ